jgi:hypothetical protein
MINTRVFVEVVRFYFSLELVIGSLIWLPDSLTTTSQPLLASFLARP